MISTPIDNHEKPNTTPQLLSVIPWPSKEGNWKVGEKTWKKEKDLERPKIQVFARWIVK
jgi:hypothetical protein